MPKHQQTSKKRSSSKINPVVLVAILGLIGTLVTALAASPVVTKLIERIPTSTINVAFTPTPTLGETPTPTLVLVPTPTAWMLGNQVLPDPNALCLGTVNDYQDANRENVKRVQFNMTEQGGYCSWIIPLNGYNATSKTKVTFWIRGEKGGEQYEVGIKDTTTLPGHEPKVPDTASATWTQVSILLDRFKNQNLVSLENLSFNFKDGSGTIYVSQLIFMP